jgi:hypothetical protein
MPTATPKTSSRAAFYSYCYAYEALKGRFPEGEAAIAMNAYYSFLYARDVVKGLFPDGEAAISKDAHYSFLYARDVLKGRFPKGEATIATFYLREYGDILEEDAKKTKTDVEEFLSSASQEDLEAFRCQTA